MNHQNTTLAALGLALILTTNPAFAQHGRGAGGGPPAGRGPAMAPSASASSHGSETPSHGSVAMTHGSPSKVLSRNPAIGNKIKALTGEDAQAACSGFKNLGDCVGAAHVAKNLGIPFDGPNSLKSKMTGAKPVSLGKAIQELKPDADSKAEIKKAKKQMADDINNAGS